MNILFFLTPKSEVIYVNEEDTVGQAMDTMEKYKYSAVPIITKAGRYAGTLTEGDLLWGLKNKTDLVQKGLEKVRITEIPRRSDNQPVLVNADMEDLLGKIMTARIRRQEETDRRRHFWEAEIIRSAWDMYRFSPGSSRMRWKLHSGGELFFRIWICRL